MKKIWYLLIFIVLQLCFISCNGIDEVPPHVDTSTSNYILPKPDILTQEERDMLKARRDEYQQATGQK